MSTIEQIMSLVATLSQNDKIKLNVELASSLLSPKKAKKTRKASQGIRAWTAFVAHVQKTMPEKFAPPALPKDRLQIAGEIRLSDPAAYAAFCEKFKTENPPETESQAESQTESQAESQAESETEAKPPKATEPAAKPKRVISDEQKAKMKAGREKKAAEKAAQAKSE